MFIVSIENKNYHVKISDFQLAAARTEIHIISKKQKTEYWNLQLESSCESEKFMLKISYFLMLLIFCHFNCLRHMAGL